VAHNQITGHGAVMHLAHEPSHTPQPLGFSNNELQGKIASHNWILSHGAVLPLPHTDLTSAAFENYLLPY
jgi:hypothetical protein